MTGSKQNVSGRFVIADRLTDIPDSAKDIISELVDILPKVKTTKKDETVKYLIWNMLHTYNTQSEYLVLPRDPTWYTDDYTYQGAFKRGHLSHTFTKRFIGAMEEQGYLSWSSGVYSTKGIVKEAARVYLSDKFYKLLSEREFRFNFGYTDIVLKKTKGGVKVPERYRMTKRIQSMLQSLQDYNNWMFDNYVVSLDGIELGSSLKRVFTEDFKGGGRFYSSGSNSYQRLPKEKRGQLKINSESVVELDFSSILVRILYDDANIILLDSFDPYVADYVLPLECTREWSKEELRSILRALCKLAVNCLLNCSSEHLAIMAVNNEVKEDYNLPFEKRKYPDVVMSYREAKNLVQAVYQHNHEISESFFADKGQSLVKRESNIASFVLEKCMEIGVPVLCIHDGFITTEVNEGQLMNIMQEGYGIEVNSPEVNNCKIKVETK